MDELIKELLVRNHDSEFLSNSQIKSTDILQIEDQKQAQNQFASKKVIIFALGEDSREYFHKTVIQGSVGIASSLLAMFNSCHGIEVLFLEKLQYLFMYLTKFEATEEKDMLYDRIVIFGLDLLLFGSFLQNKQVEDERVLSKGLSPDMIKMCNLIMNIAHKTKHKHNLQLDIVPSLLSDGVSPTATMVEEISLIENYWKSILS